jgi:hypothetical protein
MDYIRGCDYYITDSVFIEYVGESECVNNLRIDRSKKPRWLGELPAGLSTQTWIEKNEDLSQVTVYENGSWNISEKETTYYIEELEEIKVNINNVVKIKRGYGYRIR